MDFSKTFDFLNELSLYNNREWFNSNKTRFVELKDQFEEFIDKLIPKIRQIDSSIGNLTARDCVFRIYRDVRFSPNKEPYKNHFGAYMSNGGRKSKFAGYYLHLQPNQSFIAAGAFQPEPGILKEIRFEILDNTEEYLKLIENKDFIKYFKGIAGEKGKLVPKGFPKDFKYIEQIKYKSYEIFHNLQITNANQIEAETQIINAIKIAHPFNQFLNKAILNSL